MLDEKVIRMKSVDLAVHLYLGSSNVGGKGNDPKPAETNLTREILDKASAFAKYIESGLYK
jgi:hypothetical protein